MRPLVPLRENVQETGRRRRMRRIKTSTGVTVLAGVNYQINRWVGVGADYRTFFVHRDESTPRVHRFSTGLTFSLK
jgi:outer membrane protein W